MRSKIKMLTLILLGICLSLVSMSAGVVYSKMNQIQTSEIEKDEIKINQEIITKKQTQYKKDSPDYSTFAIFGVDSRKNELDKNTRSDCIIVVSLNNDTKEIRMVSLYRDTLLDICKKEEEGKLQKCNAAYAYGGYSEAINMLNKNLDLDIEEFITVNFEAISDIVDELGGIEIDIKEYELEQLNKYINETARISGKSSDKVKKPGKQLLNGVQATTYARVRKTSGGDFQRTNRQRVVIQKILDKLQAADLITINNVLNSLLPEVKTSFSKMDILSYAKDINKYKIVDSKGFPFDKTTATIDGYGSIVIPVELESNVIKLHKLLFDEKDYEPGKTVKNISQDIINIVGDRTAMHEDGTSEYSE